MILSTMTLEEKKAEALRVWARLGRHLIAGGYPRDILFGQGAVVPKDIDIWISRRGRTVAELQVVAEGIFRKAGQELIPVEEDQYGPDMVVFKSTGPSDIEPIEVIFHPYSTTHVLLGGFDINLCKCTINRVGIMADAWAIAEFHSGKIPLVLGFLANPVKYLQYVRRVLEKYPEMKAVVDIRTYGGRDIYRAAIEEGVINAPREILQAEGQAGFRDEVGFNAREGYLRAAGNRERIQQFLDNKVWTNTLAVPRG
jgi:hypothetical protein